MNKKLIALAQAGKVAVVNDGTLAELNRVCNEILTDPSRIVWVGTYKYYWLQGDIWVNGNTVPLLPCHSVREFLQDEEEQDRGFKWGERIRWLDDTVTYIAKDPYNDELSVILQNGLPIKVCTGNLSRITPKRRITRAEIKEKLGIEGEWEIVD